MAMLVHYSSIRVYNHPLMVIVLFFHVPETRPLQLVSFNSGCFSTKAQKGQMATYSAHEWI